MTLTPGGVHPSFPASQTSPHLGCRDIQLPQLRLQVRVHLQLQQSLEGESIARSDAQSPAGVSQHVQPQRLQRATLTWEMPDSNSSGFSPLGFTIFALELNMAFTCKQGAQQVERVPAAASPSTTPVGPESLNPTS